MRNTYIIRSGKLLTAAVIGICATAGAILCLVLASGASATTRPAHAELPNGIRLIYVTVTLPTGTGTARKLNDRQYLLTSTATLKSIDKLVKGLSTVPSRSFACPMYVLADQPTLTLVFKGSANGPPLAEIEVDVAVGQNHGSGDTPCRPIHYYVRGEAQPSLLSRTFVQTVGHMISTNIS